MKHSKKTRLKMKKNHADVAGEKNPMYGKRQSDKAKIAIAEFRKSKKWMYDPTSRTQKAIDKTQINEYIQKGWKLGRLKYVKEPEFLLSF